MKLFFSPASPYVRKVIVTAIETGLDARIERLPSAAHPVNRDMSIVAKNPLGKVPTFILDDGMVLYDSRVICEYLDSLHSGPRIFPASGAARWKALQLQALGDGLLDAALLARYESVVRPSDRFWQPWADGQMAKIDSSLDAIEAEAAGFGTRVDIGTITIGCALGYLDFRFGSKDWRAGRPKAAEWYASFVKRPSMQASMPADTK
ncbi:MAG TPA: glutathione S-transferase N-terminal domain-containing protein [Alphaproteobacteria bacterium]